MVAGLPRLVMEHRTLEGDEDANRDSSRARQRNSQDREIGQKDPSRDHVIRVIDVPHFHELPESRKRVQERVDAFPEQERDQHKDDQNRKWIVHYNPPFMNLRSFTCFFHRRNM